RGGLGRVFVGGLATDYCVKATALDARRAGLDVVILEDAVRAVDVKPGDGARALAARAPASTRWAEPSCAASSRSRGSTTPSAPSPSGVGSAAGAAGWLAGPAG